VTAGTSATRHLGLDLGGTNIKWAVVERDEDGWRTLDQGSEPTDLSAGEHSVVPQLAGLAVRLRDEADAPSAPMASVGVAVPGLYIPETGVVTFLTNVPGDWSATPVGEPVAVATGLPTALINDARAFGLAELRFGAGRDVTSFIGLTLGTGVGGVIAIGDQVIQGFRGQAGELGHQTIDPDGPWCGCGNRGCVEAYARADQVAIVCDTEDPREAIERARAGDERARAGLAEIGRYLGIGIANAVTVLTPDLVILGGGWASAGDLIIEPIKAEMRRRVITTPVDRVEVVLAELGTGAGAIGAAVHGAEQAAAIAGLQPAGPPTHRAAA
jgi:glucokinase